MPGKLSTWYKDNVSEELNCLACRLYSGLGMIGIGAYLLVQSKRRPKPLETYTMMSLAAAMGGLGVARLADGECPKDIDRGIVMVPVMVPSMESAVEPGKEPAKEPTKEDSKDPSKPSN
ncbi:uncharacterized protein [Drosophila bipectinata]|uniref:uncharacterized protein n=1 Tax=Drosophila bipectinata TaxID=42026 RepID=UPI001C8957A9|nr:uncharacterized protein LOC108123863 [Drosophila bipectinata]